MMASNNTPLFSSTCASVSLKTVNVTISYFFFLLFPVALALNGIAAWVSLHLRSTTTFVVYLKNLVAADLLMTLTLPPMAASKLPGASLELRAFYCRFSGVIFYTCLYTSIALMGLISLDRYFKIVRPCGKVLGQNVAFSVVMSTLVWLMLFGGTAIPNMILTDQKPVNVTVNEDLCISMKSLAGVIFHSYVILSMEILFWLISIMIVFCYICITLKVLQSFRNSGSSNSRGKTKTKLRVFLILLVFFVCFVPLHMVRIPHTLYEVFDKYGCTQKLLVILHEFVLWVSTINTCLDPLLYIYLCREFREKLTDMMKAKGICIRLYSDEREET